jgi:hypothetical protein
VDDLQQKFQWLERALLEQVQNVNSLKYSLQAVKVYLLTNSPEPEEAAKFFDAAEAIAPEFDQNKDFYDQVQAYLDLLAAGKKPKDGPDA